MRKYIQYVWAEVSNAALLASGNKLLFILCCIYMYLLNVLYLLKRFLQILFRFVILVKFF